MAVALGEARAHGVENIKTTATGGQIWTTKPNARFGRRPRAAATVTGGRTSSNLQVLHQHSALSDPMGEAFDYAKEFKSLDLDAVIKDLARPDDRFAGLVAGRLRPLRAAVHPHGLAQRRHLPHRRRPRRRRRRPAALRAAQQLAGQRQPRQGAPAAVADQAEIRPEDLLGRPDDPRRQRRAGIDGLQDLRLRRRPRGRLGARRGHLLGPRRQVAGRRALQRRPRARESARRRADGPDLRQSGRAERQAGSGRGGPRHPRDLRAHGDERRGDRRADRRRPHLRQDPRRRRSVTMSAPEPEGGRHRGAGPRLEEQLRQRQRRRRDHQRPGSHLDHDADQVEQQLLREPVQLRMGADQEPGRRASVDAEEWRRRRHGAGRARPVEAACADRC